MLVASARSGERQEPSQADHDADRRKPVTWLHASRIVKSNGAKNDNQLGSNEGLDERERADAQRKNLKHESENHARDPDKPDWSPKEVADQVDVETELLGRRGRRAPLGNGGGRRKH